MKSEKSGASQFLSLIESKKKTSNIFSGNNEKM